MDFEIFLKNTKKNPEHILKPVDIFIYLYENYDFGKHSNI